MKLDKQTYIELRSDMRQELVRLVRAGGPGEWIGQSRRLSRLDMSWARGVEWNDYIPGESVDTVFHGSFD